MKKLIIIFCVLGQITLTKEVSWKISAVYVNPESGLHFIGAHRLKNNSVKSTYIDRKIKESVNKPVVLLGYEVSASLSHGTLCIKMRKDNDTSLYELCVDCARGKWGRDKRIKHMIDIPIDAQDHDKYHARAWIMKDKKMVASTYQPFADDDQTIIFDIIIIEEHGAISIRLDPPLDIIRYTTDV